MVFLDANRLKAGSLEALNTFSPVAIGVTPKREYYAEPFRSASFFL